MANGIGRDVVPSVVWRAPEKGDDLEHAIWLGAWGGKAWSAGVSPIPLIPASCDSRENCGWNPDLEVDPGGRLTGIGDAATLVDGCGILRQL